MKIRKNRIHLFILLFAVSSLLVHSPSDFDAYAAADTWTDATTTDVGTNNMYGVSMSDASNGVAVGNSGQIVYTTNGGVDWTDATTTDVGATHMYGVSMIDASNGVAVGASGQIVYTTNGGVTWTDATTTDVGATHMYGVSMIDASNGVAVGQSGQIVYTTNGGVDWTDATTTDVGATYMRGVSMSDASNGVAVGNSGQIVYTTNGGVDWTDATTTDVGATHMYGVSMIDASNGVAVGKSGQIVYTTNGGVDWTDATTTNVGANTMHGVSMSDASNGVAVGYTGQIVFTDTGTPSQVGTASTTAENEQVTLSWSAPAAGDSDITDYIIQYSTDDSTWSTFADGTSTSTTATVTGLSGGTTYYFRVAAVNSLGTGSFSSSSSVSVTSSSSSSCYDCEAPKLTKVEVHVSSSPFDYVWNFDQKTPYPMFEDPITPIIADPGDEVEIILELTDNRTLKRIADSGTYTNFLTKPDDMNTFYANNFDEYGKVSTTYYEWHNTGEDLVYDYDNTVEWSEADITIEESGELDNRDCCNLDDLAGTLTISFKMKFLQPMQTSDVWVQATDRSGNFFKVPLPLTLKISGNEPLLFESKVNQKVLSFFDESVLLEITSDWTGSQQDVSELATVLGIPNEQLPPWVTNLAVWVSEDRITLVDMIVSIEHLINN